jgi:hypothetical protein
MGDGGAGGGGGLGGGGWGIMYTDDVGQKPHCWQSHFVQWSSACFSLHQVLHSIMGTMPTGGNECFLVCGTTVSASSIVPFGNAGCGGGNGGGERAAGRMHAFFPKNNGPVDDVVGAGAEAEAG